VFKENAKELFNMNRELFIRYGISDEILLEQIAKNNKLINHPLFETIIKVE
jgi:hypothetical protein